MNSAQNKHCQRARKKHILNRKIKFEKVMKLYYTPRSHFSRKVRILIDAFNLDVDLVDIGNVAEQFIGVFGPNPLMKVPTLIDKGVPVFDSDYIAQYLVQQFDSSDRFQVLTNDAKVLNARAVMNGVMSAEVELILAERSGIATDAYPRFDKIRGSISNGLDWLESRAEMFPNQPTYLRFHLNSMWDHLALYGLVSLDYPKLYDSVERLRTLTYVEKSAPR
ncbi:glutathione S-transferase family protein [Microbulbifer spongiae]|uniref:Glutathione S-transferase n=1 Tax=Microbulbifer spongiae TaxID=2944933 RepID=A0ABY9E986_9GAMM|nr:glutathione S-transferase [Microbulbifer sp. MI-G]WKD49614.1 glutathione S-transferase [Microbulbifer sp. MI-G]